MKQQINQIKGYHVHRQRLYLNNFELLNSYNLDYYELLKPVDLHLIKESEEESELNINLTNQTLDFGLKNLFDTSSHVADHQQGKSLLYSK